MSTTRTVQQSGGTAHELNANTNPSLWRPDHSSKPTSTPVDSWRYKCLHTFMLIFILHTFLVFICLPRGCSAVARRPSVSLTAAVMIGDGQCVVCACTHAGRRSAPTIKPCFYMCFYISDTGHKKTDPCQHEHTHTSRRRGRNHGACG